MQQYLSIVIPVYKMLLKHQKHFVELVASLNKSLAHAPSLALKELVVVNDFPEEDVSEFTNRVCTELGLGTALILLQNTERLGQDGSRNRAFEHTTGQYIHFIDHDDWVSDSFYEVLFQTQTGQDVLMGELTLYASYTQEYQASWKKYTSKLYQKANTLADLSWFLLSNIAVSPGQYVIKREAFENVGGFPVLANKGSDDYGLMFLLAQKNATLNYQPKAQFLYRLHENQGLHYLDLNKAVAEFFGKYVQSESLNWQMKLVRLIKTNPNPIFGLVQKLFYVCFFNRYKAKKAVGKK